MTHICRGGLEEKQGVGGGANAFALRERKREKVPGLQAVINCSPLLHTLYPGVFDPITPYYSGSPV